MKNILLCFLLCIISLCVCAQKTQHYTPAPQGVNKKVFGMSFQQRHFDLGKVKKGEKRDITYSFSNTGTEDIVIEIISACECTTLDWPRSGIKPGETAEIKAVFDSSEKEASETIEIDINLKNKEADTGYKRLEIVSYSFELIK